MTARAGVGVILAALAVAGCGGSGGNGYVTTLPYPNGPWSAGDQGTFMGACEFDASGPYCKCALRVVMQMYPDTSDLPGPIRDGGTTAAQHKNDFPACKQR